MKKFLVVGVGGSGGATLRWVMDQLRADLRAHGIESIPAAWQFVHIDVNPEPERTEGLGSIRDLGGRYVSVSTPSNAFDLVRRRVTESLQKKNALDTLVGWAPGRDAAGVNVVSGAGQYRGVGRMLTLTSLGTIQRGLNEAWGALQAPDAWGELPSKWPAEGPYSTDSEVVPMVVGSLAGGSGAAMFLDVCRLLGRVDGIRRTKLGVFLYSPDVFHSLAEDKRTGIDGNAMGALGDLIAAQTRAGDEADNRIFQALGLPPETVDDPAFGRVFPIGSFIGGSGARFGVDTKDIYRGIGRALAATIGSDRATQEYISSKVENPTPPDTDSDGLIGWAANAAEFNWGSFGYASLSLGRDRYGEYAAQRLARGAVDRLLEGFLNPTSQQPATQQLDQLVDNQWSTILERLHLPTPSGGGAVWLKGEELLAARLGNEARLAASGAVQAMQGIDERAASEWLNAVNLQPHQATAVHSIRTSAYRWAEAFAQAQEARTKEEFLRIVAHPHQGLPYARAVIQRLRREVSNLAEGLRKAPAMSDQPLALGETSASIANQLGKTNVGRGHDLARKVTEEIEASARKQLVLESARLADEVLSSYVESVLGALERAASEAMDNLEAARRETSNQAGFAQLGTTIYREWPEESHVVPPRFTHAENEVLLATAGEFPERFENHVLAASDDGVYATMLTTMLEQIVRGQWKSTGAAPAYFSVLTERSKWRPAPLPRDAESGEPTPSSEPAYHLSLGTKDLLERARAYTARKDHPFEKFSSQTFEEFLNEPGITESERAERQNTFVTKFDEAVQQARPLVGVNRSMVEAVHGRDAYRIELTFSAVPLTPNSAVATEIRAMLEQKQELINSESARQFERALSSTTDATRIAIFGSYPKFSPVVFNSFLDQLQKRWSSAPELAKRDIWKWKRTRPLPASLAMSPEEFRALITGWYIGRSLGLVTQPASYKSPDPIQVYDVEDRVWRKFDDRLLTARDRYLSPGGFDWLPGLLEGHTLAVVNSSRDTNLNALTPYRALRRIADAAPQPTPRNTQSKGDDLLRDWLTTGEWPSGRPSQVEALHSVGPDLESRAEALAGWLHSVATWIERRHLLEGQGLGEAARPTLDLADVNDLEAASLFAEIALPTHEVVVELHGRVERIVAATARKGDLDAPGV